MNALTHRAHCGCTFNEDGALLSRCAGHSGHYGRSEYDDALFKAQDEWNRIAPLQRGKHITPPVPMLNVCVTNVERVESGKVAFGVREPYTAAKVDAWTLALRWLVVLGAIAWGWWLVRMIGRLV